MARSSLNYDLRNRWHVDRRPLAERVEITPMTNEITSVPHGVTRSMMPSSLGRAATIAFFMLASLVIASIAAPGVAAIGAFRTLPTLDLQLPAFAEYAQHDTAIMGRIAAGQTMHPIFSTAMLATTGLAFATLLAWIGVQAGGAVSHRRPSARLANGAIVLLCSLAIGSVMQRGALEHTLGQYLTEAKAGDRVRAEAARAQFDGYHRSAERLNQAQLLVAMAAIALAATAVLPRGSGRQ